MDIDKLSDLVKKMNRFDRIADSDEEELIVVFMIDGEENELTLKRSDENSELIYLQDDMMNPRSPEFRLSTFFGLHEGYDKGVDLQEYADEFSFDIDEKYDDEGWNKRYPKMVFSNFEYMGILFALKSILLLFISS